jgi:hypothetical protein
MASYDWGQASPSSSIRSASLVRRTACQLIQARKASTLAANLAPPGSHPADRITDRTRQNRARGAARTPRRSVSRSPGCVSPAEQHVSVNSVNSGR